MANFLFWLKKNKLTIFLFLIIVFLLLKDRLFYFYQKQKYTLNEFSYPSTSAFKSSPLLGIEGDTSERTVNLPPPTNISERLVVKESYLSLLVENVIQTEKLIVKKTQQLGGYLVTSYLDNPQEAATATITVRIPAKKLDQALEYFRQLSVKVISENLQGQDVTDQYVDNKARLETLLKTKAKFEEILQKVTKIEDILNVQREIINLQSQIDSIKGQQQYLEQSAALSKITIYLSADELSLPYAPKDLWRPKVIFKQAVRSLISNLRQLATILIWLVVYSVIWLPTLFIFFLIRKKLLKK